MHSTSAIIYLPTYMDYKNLHAIGVEYFYSISRNNFIHIHMAMADIFKYILNVIV